MISASGSSTGGSVGVLVGAAVWVGSMVGLMDSIVTVAGREVVGALVPGVWQAARNIIVNKDC